MLRSFGEFGVKIKLKDFDHFHVTWRLFLNLSWSSTPTLYFEILVGLSSRESPDRFIFRL